MLINWKKANLEKKKLLSICTISTLVFVFVGVRYSVFPWHSSTDRLLLPRHKNCYYTNWAQFRKGANKFLPGNIDASLCSNIIYSFYNFTATSISNGEWNDDAMLAQILAFKSKNPAMKVLLSIGGWAKGISTFQQIIKTKASRSNFNQIAISFLRQKNADGIDIDMEYPGAANRGGLPFDKPRFAAWLQEMAAAFKAEAAKTGKPRLLLSAALGANIHVIDKGYDIPKISSALDFIHLMTYDFHSAYLDNYTGFNSPLYKLSSWTGLMAELTTNFSVNYLLSKGASANKLIVGIPLYGHSFTLRQAEDPSIGAPVSGPGLENGFISYYEICLLNNTSYTYKFNSEAKVPYMYSGTSWISTEDVQSVNEKAKFVVEKKLGGVMYWALDLDDFNGRCGNGKYPLMKAVSKVLDFDV